MLADQAGVCCLVNDEENPWVRFSLSSDSNPIDLCVSLTIWSVSKDTSEETMLSNFELAHCTLVFCHAVTILI